MQPTTATGTVRAASYSRQSIDNGERIDTQRQRNRATIERNGWQLVREYSDNDTSATKLRGESTDWWRMLSDLDNGLFDVIVVTEQDRLLRDALVDGAQLVQRGAQVVDSTGWVDLTNPHGKFASLLKALVGGLETDVKATRQRSANLARAEKGIPPRGPWRPFGYQQVNAKKVERDDSCAAFTIIPEEAAAIRDAFEMYLAGSNRGDIARDLSARGFRTSQGNEFNALAVKVILSNPLYVGRVIFKGKDYGKSDRWEPIVDQETFDAVQEKVRGQKRETTPMTVARHMLTGVLRCSVCGSKLRIGYSGVHGRIKENIRIYRCMKSHVSHRADALEAHITGLALRRLSEPDAHKMLQTADHKTAKLLRDERQAVEGQLQGYAEKLGNGQLTDAQFDTLNAIKMMRLAEIKDALAVIAQVEMLGPLVLADDTKAVWDALPIPRKRAVLQQLMEASLRSPGQGRGNVPTPELVDITWHQ